MSASARLITRIALFAALIYVLCWATSFLPNISLSFFVAFSAGYLWGYVPGILVGAIGMWLWSTFNPYGPASLPVTISQVLGMLTCGAAGAVYARLTEQRCEISTRQRLALAAAGLMCTVLYYLPVSVVDAWVYQPFWPRLWTSVPFVGISAVSNLLIFPLLFGVTLRLYAREHGVSR
jgi:uncharacterized membrane protein